jgi:hypothetical protein
MHATTKKAKANIAIIAMLIFKWLSKQPRALEQPCIAPITFLSARVISATHTRVNDNSNNLWKPWAVTHTQKLRNALVHWIRRVLGKLTR